jgi:sugar lactone lactonase YvrE
MRIFLPDRRILLLDSQGHKHRIRASTRSFVDRAQITFGRWQTILVLLTVLGLSSSCMARPAAEEFATGLNQPRGMAFDARGNLFVAEAGAPDPMYDGATQPEINHSGRVLRIDTSRRVTTVVDGLPYTRYTSSGDVGAADVAVLDEALYVLTGEGYDDELSRSVLRATPGGRPQPVASILNFAIDSTPLDQQQSAGGVPTNPFAMAAAPDGSAIYVTDGASGRVLRVTLDGHISLFAELPKMPPLTGLAFGPDKKLYVTMFSTLPHTPGSGQVWTVDADGKLAVAVRDLTMPIDIGFDATGTMYVLEFSDGRQPNHPYAASNGRLLRFERDGLRRVVLDQINYPTAMAFSQVDDLYIAVNGAFAGLGQGGILKIPCRSISSCCELACSARAGG